MFDKDGYFSRLGTLETTTEAIRIRSILAHRKPANNAKRNKFFQTSELVHTLYPRPTPGRSRKMQMVAPISAIKAMPSVERATLNRITQKNTLAYHVRKRENLVMQKTQKKLISGKYFGI